MAGIDEPLIIPYLLTKDYFMILKKLIENRETLSVFIAYRNFEATGSHWRIHFDTQIVRNAATSGVPPSLDPSMDR